MSRSLPVRQHAVLGPSSAKRWMTCPGSVDLVQEIPDETSEYALEGTCAHHVAEQSLLLDVDPREFVGEVYEGIHVDESMAEYVSVFTDYVRQRARAGTTPAQMLIERRVSLESLDPPQPIFGTADVILYWDGGMLEVIDLKYGRGLWVGAEGNPQLLLYLLMASLEKPVWSPWMGDCSPYVATIVQPRNYTAVNGPVRSARYSPDDLIQFSERVLEAARRTVDDPQLVPGEHCRTTFCPAQATCPALRSHALEAARDAFSPPAPTDLTPQQLSEILDRADVVEAWIKAVREHAHAELEHGREVPGFKLVSRRARRQWRSEDEARAWAERTAADELLPRKLVSPAQAEKIVGKAHVPDDLVKSVSSGTKLARDDHPHPALPAGPETVFGAVSDGEDITMEDLLQ